MSAFSSVDGEAQHECGWRWEAEALCSNTDPIRQPSFNCSSSSSSLLPAEYLFISEVLSFANNECWSRLVFWWPSLEIQTLLWVWFFLFFCVTFENAEGYIQWKCKTNPSFAVKLRKSLAFIKNDPVFFLFRFSAGSNLNEFLLQLRSSCYLNNLIILCLLQVLVMQWWSFCAFSVSALTDSGRGLLALGKADPKLCRSAQSKSLLYSLFWFFLPPSFSVALPFASVDLSVTWNKVSGGVLTSLKCPLTCFYSGKSGVTGFCMSTRLP